MDGLYNHVYHIHRPFVLFYWLCVLIGRDGRKGAGVRREVNGVEGWHNLGRSWCGLDR